MWDIVFRFAMLIYGTAFAAGLLGFMSWRHGHRWRRLATFYPGNGKEVGERFHMESIFLYADHEVYNHHQGTVIVTIAENGIGLRMMLPLNALYPPIFIPVSDIRLVQENWLLMGPVCQMRFWQCPELNLVMPGRPGDWLLANSFAY